MNVMSGMEGKATTFHENGEQVFPCRCGETHRGDYAIYEFGHHNCFHEAPLYHNEDGYVCPECGKDFVVESVRCERVEARETVDG